MDLSGHRLARSFGIERLRSYRIAAGSGLDAVGLVKGTDFEPVALAKRQVGEIEAVLGPRPAAKQAIGRVVARFLDEAAQRVGVDGSGVDRDRHQLGRISGLSGAVQERLGPGPGSPGLRAPGAVRTRSLTRPGRSTDRVAPGAVVPATGIG